MKALRLILSGVLLALFALFALNNWTYAPVSLPNGTLVSMPLPVIVAIALLVGWLPMLLIHLASRATWKRRALRAERLLDEALSPRGTPTATAFVPVLPPRAPAQGQPTVVPPAGA